MEVEPPFSTGPMMLSYPPQDGQGMKPWLFSNWIRDLVQGDPVCGDHQPGLPNGGGMTFVEKLACHLCPEFLPMPTPKSVLKAGFVTANNGQNRKSYGMIGVVNTQEEGIKKTLFNYKSS